MPVLQLWISAVEVSIRNRLDGFGTAFRLVLHNLLRIDFLGSAIELPQAKPTKGEYCK